MDKIWDRKSFEVGGHWRCGGHEKTRMTTQNRQKVESKKQQHKNDMVLGDVNIVLERFNNSKI